MQTAEELWAHLLTGSSAITPPPAGFVCKHNAGYLHQPFDKQAALDAARSADVDAAEAAALDPQQALALALTARALAHCFAARDRPSV